MGTIYRVTVVEETTDAGGGHVSGETLFELAGRADMVARTAPAALVDALTPTEAPGALAERVMDGAMAALPGGESERPRRPRRTKAQMEADRLAAEQPAAAPAASVMPAAESTVTMPAPAPAAPYNPFGQPAA